LNFRHFIKLILILTLATLACGLASPAPASPTPVPVQSTAPAPTVTPTTAQLTVDQLKNAQYQLGARDDHAVVQLTDGKYQQGTDTTTLDYAHIELAKFISVGDLTGDGINEAAAIFFENYGGSGVFGFLAIYTNVNGLPAFLSSTLIDDRPKINSITIEDGEVYLDAVIHGAEDLACCPALQTTRSYALVNNKLRMTNYSTSTPNGVKRTIEIISPANGTESKSNVEVSGTVRIAPFENNLSYFIYDGEDKQLASGSVPVTAADPGAPGTFSELIPLTGISTDTTIYLEIQDISAADGSWLAMDSVKLIVK
jgi:hypothetical protein